MKVSGSSWTISKICTHQESTSVQPSKAMERDWGQLKEKIASFCQVELEMKSCRARLRSVKENEHNQNENLGHCITLKQIMVKAMMARPSVKWKEC